MTTYFVGIGGDDGANGTSWATRKLTLNGAENIPVAAGDTVYVGPGTYRELLTVDVSGNAGNPITYVGDYLGTMTDGIGGVVRITGSDDDRTAARAYCITATTKTYRTFSGFTMDICTSHAVNVTTGCTNWIINNCYFEPGAGHCIHFSGLAQSTNTIRGCFFRPSSNLNSVNFSHSAVVDNAGHLVENCIFLGGYTSVGSNRVGGITVKNSVFIGKTNYGIYVETAITAGQTVTVNNCVFSGVGNAIRATAAGEIVENYNSFSYNGTDRTNTNTGAQSNTYPPLFDSRWFFQMVFGGQAGKVITPWDLASYSQLIGVAGTSPTATDIRGTGTVGAQREWGALEYDPTLKIAGRGRHVGGGFRGD